LENKRKQKTNETNNNNKQTHSQKGCSLSGIPNLRKTPTVDSLNDCKIHLIPLLEKIKLYYIENFDKKSQI